MRGAMLSGCLAVLLVPVTALAQATISKEAIRSQAPGTTDKQLAQQLWELFEHQDRRSKSKGTVPLRSLWLNSKPYAQPYAGLCRRDVVVMNFVRADGDDNEPDNATPTRAYGVDASQQYAFTKPPEKWSWDQDDTYGRRSTMACAATDWVTADSAETANDGYLALTKAVAMVKAGQLMPHCTDIADHQPCDLTVGGFLPQSMGQIRSWDLDPNSICYRFWMGNYDVSIVVQRSYASPRPATMPPDGTIRSITADATVVIADQLRD